MTQTLFRLLLSAPFMALSALAAVPGSVDPGFTFRLTTSWADQPTGELSVAIQPGVGNIKVNAQQGGIDYPTLAPHGSSLNVTLIPAQPRSPFLVAKLLIPAKGDDFALIVGSLSASATSAWLLPSDLAQFPAGSTYVINRSANSIRIFIEEDSVIIEKGAFKLHPLVAKSRLVARLRIEALSGPTWTTTRSNRVIISPDQRMVLLIGPSQSNTEPFAISGVVDANSGSYQKPIPIKEAPPLPGQPAK
jgi:hypothetical protein